MKVSKLDSESSLGAIDSYNSLTIDASHLARQESSSPAREPPHASALKRKESQAARGHALVDLVRSTLSTKQVAPTVHHQRFEILSQVGVELDVALREPSVAKPMQHRKQVHDGAPLHAPGGVVPRARDGGAVQVEALPPQVARELEDRQISLLHNPNHDLSNFCPS